MTSWQHLSSAARVECAGYLLLAAAGLLGTQGALFDLVRHSDGDLLDTVWHDLTLSPTTAFVAIDLLVVFVAAMVFMTVEGRRLGLRRWAAYPLLGVGVGISLGLPLFLLARRLRLSNLPTGGARGHGAGRVLEPLEVEHGGT